MEKLTERHGQEATKQPLLLKMTSYANQLLMNEIEVCYWHGLNLSRPQMWADKPSVVVEKLLVHALFAKMNSTDAASAGVFKTFIMHNYRDVMKNHWREFQHFPESDQ